MRFNNPKKRKSKDGPSLSRSELHRGMEIKRLLAKNNKVLIIKPKKPLEDPFPKGATIEDRNTVFEYLEGEIISASMELCEASTEILSDRYDLVSGFYSIVLTAGNLLKSNILPGSSLLKEDLAAMFIELLDFGKTRLLLTGGEPGRQGQEGTSDLFQELFAAIRSIAEDRYTPLQLIDAVTSILAMLTYQYCRIQEFKEYDEARFIEVVKEGFEKAVMDNVQLNNDLKRDRER